MRLHQALCILTGMTILLSACGTQSTASPATEPANSQVENTQAPTSTPEAAVEPTEESAEEEGVSTSSEPVEVSFWYPYGDGSDSGNFLAEQIAAFNAENPDVVVTGQSYEDYASIIEGIQRGAAGNDLPSIAAIGFGYDDYIIESGLAQPIEPLLGDDAETALGDIYPALLDITTYDGQVYGVPFALSVAEVFYYPDIFEQAGLDPDNPPQTWDEFVQAAQTIYDKTGIAGATFAMDDPWIFETAVRSSGAELLSADGVTSNLASDPAVKILQDWGDGVKSGAFLYNADFTQTLQTFGNKQVAMFAVSSYGTAYYHGVDPTIKAMAFPSSDGNSYQSPAGGNSLYILGNDDAERQAAARFIAYLDSPEVNAAWAQISGYLPIRPSTLDVMQDYIAGFDNYSLAVNLIPNVVAPTHWPSQQVLKVKDVLMNALETVLLGQDTAQNALQQADQEVNELLAQ